MNMTVCKHCFVDSATLGAQSDKIETLEQEVRRLQLLLKPDPLGDRPEGFTPKEAKLLSLLLGVERVSRVRAIEVIGTNSQDPYKIVDVYVCKLRKKLSPLGLEIHCIWGWGYMIPREQREAAKEKLAA